MTSESSRNIVERQCSMTTPGLIDILPGKPYYVYIADVTAKSDILPKFEIFTFASNTKACIIHVSDDETYILKNEGQVLNQCEKGSTNEN